MHRDIAVMLRHLFRADTIAGDAQSHPDDLDIRAMQASDGTTQRPTRRAKLWIGLGQQNLKSLSAGRNAQLTAPDTEDPRGRRCTEVGMRSPQALADYELEAGPDFVDRAHLYVDETKRNRFITNHILTDRGGEARGLFRPADPEGCVSIEQFSKVLQISQ